LWYLVSVLTAEVEDEHQLLWRMLAILMRHQHLPTDVLPDALKFLDPAIVTRIEDRQDGRSSIELWNALGVAPRAAFCYVVTAPLDLEVALELPLVLTRSAHYKTIGGQVSDRTGIQIGGVVRDGNGRPLPQVIIKRDSSTEEAVTNADGQYVLRGLP